MIKASGQRKTKQECDDLPVEAPMSSEFSPIASAKSDKPSC